MKIHEAATLVGMTDKNIRFYEAEGLLAPRRNSQNGYRTYGEEDIARLRQIKLLRKLGLPLEEIRRMQAGEVPVAEAMRRHRARLEEDMSSLAHAARLCESLQKTDIGLDALDAEACLAYMAGLEKEGTTFMDRQKQDIRKRYVAPVVITLLVTLVMGAVMGLFIWALVTETPPLPMAVFLTVLVLLFPLLVIGGTLAALSQRIREIQGGEEDAASKY